MAGTSRTEDLLDPLTAGELYDCFYTLGSYSKRLVKGNLAEMMTHMKLKRSLLHVASIFSHEDTMVDVSLRRNRDLIVVSDIHGNATQLLRWFEKMKPPPENRFIFLGGYIDYGTNGLEVLFLLFLYKIAFPGYIHLLRGKHEYRDDMALEGSFYKECAELGPEYFDLFHVVFNEMPWLARIIPTDPQVKSVLCGHSGISEWFLPYPDRMFEMKKHGEELGLLDKMIFTDIMFSKPKPEGVDIDDYAALAAKGIGRFFNRKQLKKALRQVECETFIRGTMGAMKDKNPQASELMREHLYAEVNSGGAMGVGSVQVLIVSLFTGQDWPNFRYSVESKFHSLRFSWRRKVWSEMRQDFYKATNNTRIHGRTRDMVKIYNYCKLPIRFPKMVYDHAELAVMVQYFPDTPYRHLDVHAPREGVVMLYLLLVYAFYPTSIDTTRNAFTAPFENVKRKWFSDSLLAFGASMRRQLMLDPTFLDELSEDTSDVADNVTEITHT